MEKEKNRKKSSQWLPPKGALKYFSTASDYEFIKKNPIGYAFLMFFGIVAVLLPVVLYFAFVIPFDNNSPWLMLGCIGGFSIGVGLFNFVAIFIKQYLGHLVSILSFVIGGILIWISLMKIGMV